jgi:hypothetical protein
VLRDAGLVTGERKGYYIHYRVNEDALARLLNLLDGLLPCTKSFYKAHTESLHTHTQTAKRDKISIRIDKS